MTRPDTLSDHLVHVITTALEESGPGIINKWELTAHEQAYLIEMAVYTKRLPGRARLNTAGPVIIYPSRLTYRRWSLDRPEESGGPVIAWALASTPVAHEGDLFIIHVNGNPYVTTRWDVAGRAAMLGIGDISNAQMVELLSIKPLTPNDLP